MLVPSQHTVEASQIVEDCKDALYAAKICSYAQGMCLIQAASDQVKIGEERIGVQWRGEERRGEDWRGGEERRYVTVSEEEEKKRGDVK